MIIPAIVSPKIGGIKLFKSKTDLAPQNYLALWGLSFWQQDNKSAVVMWMPYFITKQGQDCSCLRLKWSIIYLSKSFAEQKSMNF